MIVREMKISDLDEIVKIEKELYKVPWNEKQFCYELEGNEFSYLFVLENEGVIIGYYGFWVMFENADITKVSIRKEFQGLKLSNILMKDCFNRTKLLGVENINLEVRVDNIRAISLYKKHGFKELIVRKNYYGVNEDALIMWSENIFDKKYKDLYDRIKKALEQ